MHCSYRSFVLLSVSHLFAMVAILLGPSVLPSRAAEQLRLHSFERKQLSDVYYAEGAAFGDLDGDGTSDAVSGPFWYRGPDFTESKALYPPKAQPREGYADNFFSWVTDFNGDGRNDVLVVGFPGTPAYVYQNPGPAGWDQPWPKHQVMDWVSNESPQFVQLIGDERPEMVCSRDGQFGYYSPTWDKPFSTWPFRAISEAVTDKRFGHGLGVGDVNGDGRMDVLTQNGWYQQPVSVGNGGVDDPLWDFHPVKFAPIGGADMFAYDVDGDGDNDVITSLAAHAYGLAWYEQFRDGERIEFRQHLIMGDSPNDNEYGVVFTELHSVALHDMDGDGLKDIVTGKTYWSHHTQAPMWDAGAVVYWFRLTRTDSGVHWLPQQLDAKAGIGRQVSIGDGNGDGLPDIVLGGMVGSHVLIHRAKDVDERQWNEAQPRPRAALKAGLSPDEAARHMTVPDGFQVQLAAGEPQVHQPVALTIDERGRVWVAEAYTYPNRAPEGDGRDRIVILEDTDLDGTLDKRTVFIDKLNLISGLEIGMGGVWVGAAPYLMFIPDRDRDDRPDSDPQILLDGFGYEDTHETLNSFNWGPDGWLYGCHGVFTHSRVGKPGTPDEERTPMNAAVWRYHPERHQFEVFSHGTSNPWGVDFNDEGQAFITACVIPHLWHIVQGGRYHRQGGQHFNPYTFDDIKTIADHAHYAGNITDHAWWGKEPEAPESTLTAGGGHAHCGAMVYLGDNWPASMRNNIFMNNIHGNRVNCDTLERSGSGFIGHHGKDLMLANDRWYRGINLRCGPDGTVMVIDWYDRNACHRTNPEIWDRTNGRIYNIAYGKSQRVRVDLDRATDAELVAYHLHPNDWYVRTARRILQYRCVTGKIDRDVTINELRAMLDSHPDVSRKLRALWTLHAIGALSEEDRQRWMHHENEYVRAWAIQLEMEDYAIGDAGHSQFVSMAKNDPSPVVRLYLASALQRMDGEHRWPIIEQLIMHGEDADDHNLPLLLWYALEPLVADDAARALAVAQDSRIPRLWEFVVRRAAATDVTIDAVMAVLAADEDLQRQQVVMQAVLQAFEGRADMPMPESWHSAYESVLRTKDAASQEMGDRIAFLLGDSRVYPRLQQKLLDPAQPIERRQEALATLVRRPLPDTASALQKVLDEPALRSSAIRGLAAFDDPNTPQALLKRYANMDAQQRQDVVLTLVSRRDYAQALIAAMRAGTIKSSDVHAYHVRQVLSLDAGLKGELEQLWGKISAADEEKKARIASEKTRLEGALADAHPGRGRAVFAQVCASCHTLFGDGGNVGPDLTGSNRAELDYVLENIFDPSAVVGKDYRMTILEMEDGRVVSGLIQQESDSAVTVRTINDTVVVAKSRIDQRTVSDRSMMPDGLTDPLSKAEVTDLIKYLASPTQVALRGPDPPIDSESGRVADALEGENMKVLSATNGEARNQPMGNFVGDRWSNNDHLWWTGAGPGDKLNLELPVTETGAYDLELVLTKAVDYGVVQLHLDGRELGSPIDLFDGEAVVTTGVLRFPAQQLEAGSHTLTLEITGANPRAKKAFMIGLDYVRMVRTP
ncbi:MAG: c-type cytochrome [Pirellulaceae bacterium]